MPQVSLATRPPHDGVDRPGPPRHRKPPSRRTRRSAALIALLLAGGLTATAFLTSGTGNPTVTGAVALRARAVASVPLPGRADGAATMLPQPAMQPVQAFVPTQAASRRNARPAGRATSTPVPSVSPSSPGSPGTASPTPTAPAQSPSATPTAPAGGDGGPCANPSFTTSAQWGSWNLAPYTVANNMWNIGGGGVSQTLSACSYSDWSVSATVAGGGGGVKTYPNSHYMVAGTPEISSLNSVTSTFAQSSPDAGTYEDAYDIWLNGVAGSGDADEVMIWTENHGQTPGGSPTAPATIDGNSYTVWRGASNLVSFVADANVTSGTLNLLHFFQWLIGKGWEPAGSTLVQVDYGVEIVSTNSAPETFSFRDFSVNSD